MKILNSKNILNTSFPFLFVSLFPLIAHSNPIQGTGKTQVTVNGNHIEIEGGEISSDGQNLFHSFEQFSLNTKQIGTFVSSPRIQNILGRVVGGSPSFIDGLVQLTGGNSNLFLMNPAGIVFGSNARLNVPSDFTATTATGIGFNNGYFNAFGDNNYQSLTGNPNQFAFDLVQSGAIVNTGNLSVVGANITLLGSNILNTGTISTLGGNITIAAVPGTSLVRVSHPGTILTLDLPSDRIPPDFSPLDIPELLTGTENLEFKENILNPVTTDIRGRIDASNPNGVGGSISLLGESLYVDGFLDVSGRDGGGNIWIGGDYLGGGDLPTADYTTISSGSTIRADAIANGDGGQIIIWSDIETRIDTAALSARGGIEGGNGGVVETSGKYSLFYQGLPDLEAQNGKAGTWVIDPANILIATGNITSIAGLTSSQITEIESQIGGALGTPFVLPEANIEASAIDIQLFSLDHIIVMDGMGGGELTIQNNLFFQAGLDGTGSIFINSDLDVSGTTTLEAPDAIALFGDRTITTTNNFTATAAIAADGNLTIAASEIQAQNLTTTAHLNLQSVGTIAIGETRSQSLTIQAGDDILTGNLQALGGNIEIEGAGDLRPGEISTSGGDIDIQLDGEFFSLNDLDTTRGGSDAGRIDIFADRGIQANALLTSAPDLGRNGGDIFIVSWEGNIGFDRIETYASHSAGSATLFAVENIDIVNFSNLTGAYQGGNLYLGSDNGSIGQQNANVSTGSVGNNNGGNISIVAPRGTANVGNLVSSSANGMGGRVRVTAGNVSTGDIFSTGATGGGEILLRAFDRDISTNSLQGGEITAIAPNAIAVDGTVRSDSNILLDTGLLTISGVDPFGNSLTANNITIVSGTPFEIGNFSPGGSAGSIANLTSGIFTTDTKINNFTFYLTNPAPTTLPPTTPQPDTISPAPATVAGQIARAFNTTVSTTPVETQEGESAIALTWEGLFELWLLSVSEEVSAPALLSEEESAIASPQTQINIAEVEAELVEEYREMIGEELEVYRENINEENIRKQLETIQAQTGESFGILYVLPNSEGLSLALFLPGNHIFKTVQIPEGELENTIADFVKRIGFVRADTSKVKGKILYNWIISPLEKELEGIDNIAFVLKGDLRQIPIAALHDGDRYLIEKYGVGVLPSLSLTNPEYRTLHDGRVLAFGVSQSEWGSLLGAEKEVEAIAQHYPATTFLNEQASFGNLQDNLSRASILHFATHASANDWIQLGDRQIDSQDIRDLQLNDRAIELMVLSACETAIGAGEYGFAGLANNWGVPTAIASLRAVPDLATSKLMSGFYRHLRNSPTRAGAWRSSVLDLLGQFPEVHPYYWSGFTLIGTPW